MKRFILLGIFLIFSAPSFVHADSMPAVESNPNKITTHYRYILESDVESRSGSIQVAESNLTLSREFKVLEKLPVQVWFDLKHFDIVENLSVELPSHLEKRNFGIGTKLPIPFVDSDRYFVGVDIEPSWFNDDGDLDGASFRLPFRAYGIYKESDDLIWVAGASIRPEFEQTVFPILGVIYKPNDRLTFNLASDNPNIEYKFMDTTIGFMEIDFISDEYEVTKNGVKGQILRYHQSSVGAGIKQLFTDTISGTLSVGGVFRREFEYDDGVDKVDPEAGIYFAARLEGHF